MYRISSVTCVSITEISVFKVQIIFDGLQIDSLKVIRQKEYIQIDDKVGMLMKYTIDKYIIRAGFYMIDYYKTGKMILTFQSEKYF